MKPKRLARILAPEVLMGARRMAGMLVGLAASVAALSSAGPQSPPAAPVFGVDVRVVAVPVFVTDKDGRAVSGLTQADFEVEDRGRGVAVAGFLAVDAGAPEAPPVGRPSPRRVAAARRQFLLL
jgi:hypothetical protein